MAAPGTAPPDSSLTTPVIAPEPVWAAAAAGRSAAGATVAKNLLNAISPTSKSNLDEPGQPIDWVLGNGLSTTHTNAVVGPLHMQQRHVADMPQYARRRGRQDIITVFIYRLSRK